MACWKVGMQDLIASLLLLLELESKSIDGEYCGILVEEEEVPIAEMATRVEEVVVAVGDAEEREVRGMGFEEGDDWGKGKDGHG